MNSESKTSVVLKKKILILETPDLISVLLPLLGEDAEQYELSEVNNSSFQLTIHLYKPDFIVTDHLFWQKENALHQLNELRTFNNTPIIICSETLNETLLNAVFSHKSVYYINLKNNPNTLLDTFKNT
jgi:hypothetical protein